MNEYELQDLARAMGIEAADSDIDSVRFPCPLRGHGVIDAWIDGYDDSIKACCRRITDGAGDWID